MSCAGASIQASLKLLERRQWGLVHELVSCLDAEPKRPLPSMLGSVWGNAGPDGQTLFSAPGVLDMVRAPLSPHKKLLFVRSTKPNFMCILLTLQGKEPVGCSWGCPSHHKLGPQQVFEAELALREWPQGNQQHPLPLDMQSYQISPAIKTPQKWKQQLQRIFFFSLHHFIYQPSEPWLQGLSLEQPS